MNRFILVFVTIVVLTLSTSFQTSTVNPIINPLPTFLDSEELKYSLHYGFITGGAAIISLKQESLNGSTVFHAAVKANTTGLVDKLFKVLDIYESYFDPNSNLPVKTIRNIHEGNYKQYNEVWFDHDKNTVKSQLTGEHKVPEKILDMVSSLYYIRRIDFTNFKKNDIVAVNTYFGDEVFPFYIVFKGREVLDTDLGKIKCIKFVPVVEPGRIFKNKDDMTFWLSDDDNKIPMRIKFDMVVGSFKCDLVSLKNQKFPLTSKIK